MNEAQLVDQICQVLDASIRLGVFVYPSIWVLRILERLVND